MASGHASSLLYSLLHLSGFSIYIDDLKQFRQWNSVTPGHPEYKVTHGVDASSGPLGQGVPTAIGMALAEKLMSKNYSSLIKASTLIFCVHPIVIVFIGHFIKGLTGTLTVLIVTIICSLIAAKLSERIKAINLLI